MATGMQTGMRSGMSPLSPKGGGNLFDKILQMFNSLDSKQKITGIALIGGFLFLIIIFNLWNKSSAYVELYPNNLSPLEIQEITVKLSQMNVDYKLNEIGNRIFISPSNKIRIKTQLAMQGYPRRPVIPQEEKGGGIATKTKEEIDALKQARLEGELIEEIRSIEGIADAYVKVVIPDRDSFSEDATPAKAAVMLRLQPNFKLSPNQVAGIIHLVSYAVPNLDPLNVKIVGDDGRPILANENIIKGGKEIGMLTSNQQEVQTNIENRLKKNIQDSLDSILGENKYTVGLSVEMDFSQSETQKETYGGPANSSGATVAGEKITEEKFTNAPGESSGATQMGGAKVPAGAPNVGYLKKSSTKNIKVDTVKEKIVRQTPEIKRISASVAVDNLKSDQVTKIESLVRGAIGYNESRGDQVNVVSMPFTANIYDKMKEEMLSRPAVFKNNSSNLSNQWIITIALFPTIAFLLLAGFFLLKQRKANLEQKKIYISTAGGNTLGTITDLNTDKVGKVNFPSDTALNNSEQLTKLAKEKPTKVAELLKSTWLVDKDLR